MTNKEIAGRLRTLLRENSGPGTFAFQRIREFADELDPPYKLDRSLRGWVMVVTVDGQYGILRAEQDGLYTFRGGMHCVAWDLADEAKYQVTPIRVLQPGEVAVKIAPVSEWPRSATYIGVYYANDRGPIDEIFSIDREQAECMDSE